MVPTKVKVWTWMIENPLKVIGIALGLFIVAAILWGTPPA